MLIQHQLQSIQQLFSKEPVVTVYLFGSQQKNTAGPLSDYDFAVLCHESVSKKTQQEKIIGYISQLAKICAVLEDKIDVVNLNQAHFPIAFAAIKGQRIYCADNSQRALFETAVMRQMHTDFYYIDRDYRYTIDKINKGEFFHVT